MSDGGSVLPQAEIDALFKKATGMSISPPAEAKSPAAETPAPPVNTPPPVAEAKSPAAETPAPPVNTPPPVAEPPRQAEPPPPSSPPPERVEPEVVSPPPVQPAAPVPSPPSAASNDALRDMGAALDNLTRRLKKVEASINELNQKEWDTPDVNLPIKKISRKMTALDQNLQEANSRINKVMKGLGGTPGYDIHHEFSCTSCGSHGLIAIPMRCTKCGEEGWWGWWPKEE